MTYPHTNPHSTECSDLAALAAIEALDPVQPDPAMADVAEHPEWAAEVADLQAAAALLAYDVPLVPMATTLKDRLFQRISAEDGEQPSAWLPFLTQSIADLKQRAAHLNWEPLPVMAGVSQATLGVDEDRREIAFFIRAECPGQFPRHHHATGEDLLLLEGDLVIEGQRYYPGDRIYSPANTAHQPETLQGCLLFCVSSLDDQFLT